LGDALGWDRAALTLGEEGRLMKYALAAVALPVFALANAVSAADLGGNCCADLEERIAELEATTARKGNRKVSLTVSGHVNQAVLFWDDGGESNAYVVGNENDQTNVTLTGDAEITKDLSAGYNITLQVEDNTSDGVAQDNDNGTGSLTVWQSHWYLDSKSLGRLTVGLAPRATDGVPESDLSTASGAGYAGVQDIGGSFLLRRSAGGDLSGVAWGDIADHFNGDPANVVRYDTPSIAGFVASASWGEDDIWDVALAYTKDSGDIQVAAAIGYTEVTDTDGAFADVDQNTLVGSISVLHEPSGLNLTVAAGRREFDQQVTDGDGVDRAPSDAKYFYVKAGWIAKLTGLGPTAFYGDYGRFEDYLTSGTDDDVVGSLGGLGAFDCAAAGGACRITSSEVDVFGLGVVQHIEAAEMEVYLGYRHWSADFTLADGAGGAAATAGLEDFDTFIAGSKIAF
jgi:hypothetical protein